MQDIGTMQTNKIDPNSPEFQAEFAKTVDFTDKVIKQFGFVYNPNPEVVEGVQLGLTRNKMIYGKRNCPCFFVTGNKDEDRLCPCKPALGVEIPTDGTCHCGIFCTPEFVKNQLETNTESKQQAANETADKATCDALLEKGELSGSEMETLLHARDAGVIDFKLVDVREWMENQSARIKGTDFLVSTSNFYEAAKQILPFKDQPVVVYCHLGSRSAYCVSALKSMGFTHLSNLTEGIAGYVGETEQG